MKEKIEFKQSDLIELLKDKIDFLYDEYNKLYDSFDIQKNKTTVDKVKLTESYQRFLKQSGDIDRVLKLYKSFKSDEEIDKLNTSKK